MRHLSGNPHCPMGWTRQEGKEINARKLRLSGATIGTLNLTVHSIKFLGPHVHTSCTMWSLLLTDGLCGFLSFQVGRRTLSCCLLNYEAKRAANEQVKEPKGRMEVVYSMAFDSVANSPPPSRILTVCESRRRRKGNYTYIIGGQHECGRR